MLEASVMQEGAGARSLSSCSGLGVVRSKPVLCVRGGWMCTRSQWCSRPPRHVCSDSSVWVDGCTHRRIRLVACLCLLVWMLGKRMSCPSVCACVFVMSTCPLVFACSLELHASRAFRRTQLGFSSWAVRSFQRVSQGRAPCRYSLHVGRILLRLCVVTGRKSRVLQSMRLGVYRPASRPAQSLPPAGVLVWRVS